MSTIAIYSIATIVATFFMFLATRNIKDNRILKIPLIVSFLALFLLIVLRGIDVGTDYRIYLNAYDRIVNGTLSDLDYKWLGTSFVVFCQVVSYIAKERFIIVIAIIGFLTMFLIYKAIIQNSKIPWMSVFLFVATCLFYQTFNQFRQMLAIVIVLYSIKFIKEKQLIKYIITIIVASFVHNTALIMLPIYFIAHLKVNWKIIGCYAIMLIILYNSYDLIERVLLNTTYDGYVDSYLDIAFSEKSIMNTLVRVTMLFASLGFYKKVVEDDPKDNCLYHMVLMCTVFQVMTLNSSLFGRITTYFFVFYLLLIPQIVNAIFKKPNARLLAVIMVLVLFTCYHFVYFNSQTAIDSGYTEYYFLFEEV